MAFLPGCTPWLPPTNVPALVFRNDASLRSDAESTAELTARVARMGGFVRCVPELSGDVHDLEGLARVADLVFEADPGRRENGDNR